MKFTTGSKAGFTSSHFLAPHKLQQKCAITSTCVQGWAVAWVFGFLIDTYCVPLWFPAAVHNLHCALILLNKLAMCVWLLYACHETRTVCKSCFHETTTGSMDSERMLGAKYFLDRVQFK